VPRHRPHRTIAIATTVVLALIGARAVAPGETESNRSRKHRARTAETAVLLDLAGAQASIGRPAMNGFVLGLQTAAASGYDVIPFVALLDTQSNPEITRTAAMDVASRVSMAAGFTDNDSILVAGPYFERERVPFLSIGATDPTLPDKVGRRIFLTPFGDNTQAAAAAEFARRQFGGTVAILWDDTSQYTRTLPQYFRTRFEELGGSVLLDVAYPGGCDITALGNQVTALSSTPDFVYLAGLPDCVGDVVASLRTAGVTAPVVGGDGLDTPELLEGGAGPTPTSNVWLTTHAWLSESDGTPEARAFITAYRDAYGVAPEDAFAALGFDAARLMVDVLGRARHRNPNGIFRALESTTGFDGVTGTVSFSSRSHVPSKTVWILEVQNGARSLAEAFIPDSVPPPIGAD